MQQLYTRRAQRETSAAFRWLLLSLLGLSSFPALATHFRFGNITWERIPGSNNRIKFTVTQAWRGNFFTVSQGGLGSNAVPNIGAVISTGTNLVTGTGGSPTNVPINITITAVNLAPNINDSWIYGVFSDTITYSSAGTKTAYFTQCCRISTLRNNNDGEFRVSSNVTVGNGNDAPVSTIPPIISLATGQAAASYQIPATDPNGDALTYSLTPNNGFGSGSVQPTGVSLSPGGLLTFNTMPSSTRPVGSVHNVNITVTDSRGASIQLDAMILITPPSTPPQFDYSAGQTPGNGILYQIQPGQNLSFNVRAYDNDAGDTVTVNGLGLPVGAAFSAGSGNPVTRSFSWTPTMAQLGTRQLNFVATDRSNVQSNTIVNVVVSLRPQFIAPTPGNGSGFCAKPRDTIRANFAASDPDVNDSVSLTIASGLRPGMAFNPMPTGFKNPVSTSMTWVPAAADWGMRTLVVRATDRFNEMAHDTVTWVVDNPPLIVSTPSDSVLTTGQPFSYLLQSTDPDIPYGDYVKVAHAHLPSWLSITDNHDNTFTISGTPGVTDTGHFHVMVELEDSVGHRFHTHCGSVHQNFNIQVNPCNVYIGGSVSPSTCANSGDGAISTFAANAAVPIVYSWSTGGTTNAISGLNAGYYTLSVVDAYGCTASSGFNVDIGDSVKPVIITSGNQNISTAPGICGAFATVSATASDNCAVGNPVAYRSDLQPLSARYPVGTTTVIWRVIDSNGNRSDTVYQSVTVADTELPTITAPASLTVATDANLCAASGVALGTAVTSDNCGVASVTNDAPAIFAKGATTVIWTVTDIHGNMASATQTVVVEDRQNPIIAAPSARSANADAGQCYATITNPGTPTFQDNCLGSTYASTAPANNRYAVGTTVVVYTVTDASGNQTSASQTITVTDDQNPTITAPANVTVATDANLCTAGNVALGTPATADNCGIASVTNNAPATFPKGATTVTWTVTDVNNNTATATQTVLVEDRQNPTITAPANVTTTTSADGTGNCSTTATLGTPTTADNCGVTGTTAKVGSVTINPSTYAFPTGTTIVTWTAVDAAGNTASATQTVTVTDNEQPGVNCPANVAQCFNAAGNNVALSVTSSDNCGVTATTYAITGATTGTGTGSSFSRNFAPGTSTVTWTVRDAANNTRSCSMTVIVRPLPTVTIASSNADEFCNATTLTAGIAPAGTAMYAWTYNNAAFASTQTVKLKINNGDGAFRVVGTDVYGCSSAPAVYNFSRQTLVNMYVLLGMKEVDLAQNNDVINGSVGVTSSHGEADFDRYCSVTSPGSFVKAVDIDTKSPVNITTKIYSQAFVTLPTMYLNSSNPSGLSNYVMTTNGTVTGNKKDLTINSNKTVTITGSIFRKVRICRGANVTFTAGDISIESLNMDQGATLNFSGNTKVRVSDEVTVDKECSINPAAKIVTFYIKDPTTSSYNCWGNWSSWHSWLGGSSEKFVVDGKSTNIIANVYVPNGKIRVHGNGWNCWWNQYESCNMMGLFIAEEIQGDGKNISWYSYDCATPASFRQAAHTAPIDEAADFGVMMYPNPTSGQFSLQFSNTAEAASVRITDIQGRLISARTVEVGEMPSAAFSIEGQAPGIYMVEIHQGTQTVRNRIVLR